ncbi:MAG TPA: DNA polymerase III subunit chi [Paralcaligenes sp.]|jgi:DNA polymerase-3 subunit chi
MSRIDFAFGVRDRLRTACEIIRKHYLAGREIVIYTQDAKLLERMDLLLWGFDAAAFVPHVTVNDSLAARTPVTLTTQPPVARLPVQSSKQAAWLLNLDAQCPPNVGQFERVLEIVSNSDEDRQSARERWRNYKADGHILHAHDFAKRA